MAKRIFFTGGSGKAGRHAVAYLVDRGYEVHNVDLAPLDHPGVTNLHADVTCSGQVFNALTMHRDFSDQDEPGGPKPFDAVVHFAAIPRILIKPDNETFRVNTIGTYNVIEAAAKLGIRKIIVASSETAFGVCFADGHRDFAKFPVEEDYDVDPMDTYGLSKVVNERTARAFQLRFGIDIYALRIGNVVEPHEYRRDFPAYLADDALRKRIAWSYIDARDLGQIVMRCIETDGLGYQVFNATNDHVSSNTPSRDLAARFYPDVPFTRDVAEFEGLVSNRKIRNVLGFREEYNWRQEMKG